MKRFFQFLSTKNGGAVLFVLMVVMAWIILWMLGRMLLAK